jgi:hypothetical protein
MGNFIDVEVRGGLGDLFIYFHNSTAYEEIEAMGPDDRARVTIISHNPFADEIFRWHPKLAQIEIVKSRAFIMEYDKIDLRRSVGIQDHAPVGRPRRDLKPITFYPSPDDSALLAAELPKAPFLAVAPTASGMEIENRNLPQEAVSRMVALARVSGIPVVFIGRTYQGPHAPKAVPSRPAGVVDFTDRLSIPGTAEVVKRCLAAVCAHSAILQLVWFERKPNFTMYPPKYKWHDFDNPSPFAVGKDYPETVRMLFSEFTPAKFSVFLAKNFPRSR